MITCLPVSYKQLKVWKNSSCVLSFPIKNCISSIIRTSMLRYFSLNSAFFLPLRESIRSFVNVSLVTYKTRTLGSLRRIQWAIDCIRCVLPRPAPPQINSGLQRVPGDSATASEAACANRLLEPTTKVSNVQRGFKLAFITAA